MVEFERFTLENGLKVIVHKDYTTPLATINILYNVGARDENPERTGFAHLFEHLMFGGSKNIPSYDTPLQKAGGNNNAFTNNDITNYYLTLPGENIETGFWLESDRMLNLDFSIKSLNIQRKVVIEEFNQRYLNQPYGDIWLLLRPLAYKKHPYQWATIGKNISHIKNAKLSEVREFFFNYYAPNNAVMVVAGNINFENIKALTHKWFASIEKRNIPVRKLPAEPPQTKKRSLRVNRNVPYNAIYKVYHMSARLDPDYHACDLISDILANGKSSRLYLSLVKRKKLFSEINAFITGDIDNGLFVITGKLIKNVKINIADEAIEEELHKLQNNNVSENELKKVKNKVESALIFSEVDVLNRAMNLAYYELLGNPEYINTEVLKYRNIKTEQIKKVSERLFNSSNSSTIHYMANKS